MTLSRKIADAVEALPAGVGLPAAVEAEAGPARLALELTEPDWTEIAELVETSYRQVALKRQVKEL